MHLYLYLLTLVLHNNVFATYVGGQLQNEASLMRNQSVQRRMQESSSQSESESAKADAQWFSLHAFQMSSNAILDCFPCDGFLSSPCTPGTEQNHKSVLICGHTET